MKQKILILVASLIFPLLSHAQILTSVSATITDGGGQVWANGSYAVKFIPVFNNPGPYINQGLPIQGGGFIQGNLDGTGSFTVNLDDNIRGISVQGSKWQFTFCPAASFQCTQTNQIVITGTSVNLSSTFSSQIGAIVLRPNFVIPAAYADSEVITGFGGAYVRTTDQSFRQCAVVAGCNGSGYSSISTANWGSPGSIGSVVPNSGVFISVNNQIYADVLTPSGGLCGVTGTDATAKIQCAINLLPSAGGVVHAENLTDAGGTGSNTIDPGSRVVTLFLGATTYNVKGIVLRKGFNIIGRGSSDAGTILQSVNGNTPVFTLPQSSNNPATNVYLFGFRLLGATSGNSVGTPEEGMFLDSSGFSNSGLWFSIFEDLYISGFCGNSINLKSTTANHASANQNLSFRNVTIYRGGVAGCTTGALSGFNMSGSGTQISFTDTYISGQATGDGTNITLTAGSATVFPNTINFNTTVSNNGSSSIIINGAQNIVFSNNHEEANFIGFQLSQSAGAANYGIVVRDSYFACNTGVNGGSGTVFSLGNAGLQSDILITGNTICQGSGNPDNWISNSNTVLNNVRAYDNNFTSGTAPPTSNVIPTVASAATISIGHNHIISLSASITSITTVNGQMNAGEYVTFVSTGAAQFATGGNLDLAGNVSPLKLSAGQVATFMASDIGGTFSYKLISYTGGVKTLKGSAILSYGPIAANTCNDHPITVTGALTSDTVYVSPQSALGNINLSWSAFVSAGDTVNVRVCNVSVGSITPNNVTWGAFVNR